MVICRGAGHHKRCSVLYGPVCIREICYLESKLSQGAGYQQHFLGYCPELLIVLVRIFISVAFDVVLQDDMVLYKILYYCMYQQVDHITYCFIFSMLIVFHIFSDCTIYYVNCVVFSSVTVFSSTGLHPYSPVVWLISHNISLSHISLFQISISFLVWVEDLSIH